MAPPFAAGARPRRRHRPPGQPAACPAAAPASWRPPTRVACGKLGKKKASPSVPVSPFAPKEPPPPPPPPARAALYKSAAVRAPAALQLLPPGAARLESSLVREESAVQTC
ncbi:hypothetical protein PVAP13_5KG462514 [Panicum virgatum]|uniref:Uncharacterized protein n=1 Tax=Panicum virgatum TaxID=38727 RepID=A0A8T0SSH3_PANVG|nr:hypothetical protein PVAP13_5KG462514 [Panicum virgatum]